MRRIIHRACMMASGLWTTGCLAAAVLAEFTLPEQLMRTGLGPRAIEAAVNASHFSNVLIWGAAVVPLGVLAFATRPDPAGAGAFGARRESAR